MWSLLIMKSVLIGRSIFKGMTIIVLITGASTRHVINAEEGGVWRKNKWAFNDAVDPSERQREQITIIKHLILLLPHAHLFPPASCFSSLKTSQTFSSSTLLLSFHPCSLNLFLACVWRTKKDDVQRAMRGLPGISVIFGCDISIAALNVWCQPIHYPAPRDWVSKRLRRKMSLQGGGWKIGGKGNLPKIPDSVFFE